MSVPMPSAYWCCSLGLGLALLAPVARAGVEFGLGVAEEVDGETAPVAVVSYTSGHRHPWEAMAGYLARREDAQVPDALFVAASRRYAWERWFVSAGIAWVDENNDILSGHAQFFTAAGWQRGRWSLSLRHLSNAGTNGRNRGETFVLLQFAL